MLDFFLSSRIRQNQLVPPRVFKTVGDALTFARTYGREHCLPYQSWVVRPLRQYHIIIIRSNNTGEAQGYVSNKVLTS